MRSAFTSIVFAIASVTISGAAVAIESHELVASSARDLPRYADVTAQIKRAGRPTQKGIDIVAHDGIKTVISLEDSDRVVANEAKMVRAAHMEFVNSPMSASKTPNDTDVDQVLALMKDPAKQPVLVHCHHGEDRTGLIVGLYRVLVEGQKPEVAYREMLDRGFHPQYTDLLNYYERRTGWHP